MWWTQEGNRVLRGAEAALFQEGLSSLVYWIGDFDDADGWPTGVQVFDRLSRPEQLAILEQVGRGLLVKRMPSPPLTAVNEGAIAAIYHNLMSEVEIEIDEGRRDVRRLIRAALKETGLTEEMPTLKSEEMAEWRFAIEGLVERILWDSDWAHEFVKPDDPPEMAQEIRAFGGIDEDYYIAVAPDPNPAQLKRIEKSLLRLRHKKV